MAQELKDSLSNNTAIEDKSLSKEDIVDLLSEEDSEGESKEEESEEKEEESDKKDEKEEEIEISEEESEEVESKDEIETPVSRKQILAKYPKIFKDFPQLQKSMYRDKEFTELLGDPKDAEEVLVKAKNLDEFTEDLVGKADTEKLLRSIKQVNEKSFNKIIDNYLPVLAKVDEKAFYHVVGTVIDNVITGMIQEARRLGKENGTPLEEAATLLNQYMNGTVEFRPRGRLAPEESKNEEADKLQQEREQFIQEKFESKRSELDSRVSKLIKSTIERNIDPKEEMSDYVKKAAVREAVELTQQLIDGDESYQKVKDRLWEQAFEDNLSQKVIDRIQSAHLSKAKAILRDVIKKARNNALKGPGQKEETRSTRKGTLPVGRATTRESGTKTTDPKAIPKGMKSLDYLMQD